MYLRRHGGEEEGGGGGRGEGEDGDVFDLPFSEGLCINVVSFCCVRDGIWSSLMGKEWRPAVWAKKEEEEEGGGERSRDVCRYPYRNVYWSCC